MPPELPPPPEAPSRVSTHDIVSHPYTITFIQIKARQLARRSDFSRSDADDLQQDMLLHLLKKSSLFDPARGNVEAFVTHLIKTWITQHLRDRQARKRGGDHRQASLSDAFVASDGVETTRAAFISQIDAKRHLQAAPELPSIEAFERREAVRHALAQLPPQDHDLLTHAARDGVSSAVRAYGLPRCHVERKLRDMREIFRNSGFSDR